MLSAYKLNVYVDHDSFINRTTVGNNNRDIFSENVPVLRTLLVANSVCKSGEGEVCVPSKYPHSILSIYLLSTLP